MSRLHTYWQFRHYGPSDRLLWASGLPYDLHGTIYKGSREDLQVIRNQIVLPNALTDAGEKNIVEAYFRAELVPTGFLMGLTDDNGGLAEGSTLAQATDGTHGTEPVGNGYNRQTVERSNVGFPTLQQTGGDWEVRSTTETFSATGAGYTVDTAFLTQDPASTLILFAALSQTRVLGNGDSLQVNITVRLS